MIQDTQTNNKEGGWGGRRTEPAIGGKHHHQSMDWKGLVLRIGIGKGAGGIVKDWEQP